MMLSAICAWHARLADVRCAKDLVHNLLSAMHKSLQALTLWFSQTHAHRMQQRLTDLDCLTKTILQYYLRLSETHERQLLLLLKDFKGKLLACNLSTLKGLLVVWHIKWDLRS